jgi:AcrR family transcriptional regulator
MNESESTRAALLAVAAGLFATQGYEASSVRQITARAGANLGSITYHFGSKESLYHTVLRATWEPVLSQLEEAAEGATSPLDRIELVLRALFESLSRKPEIAPIMLREISRDGLPPPVLQETVRRLFGLLHDLVRSGQADGSIVAGDPQLLTLSILAQPFHVMSLRRKMGHVIGLDATRTPVFERIVDNAVAFMRRGLSTRELIP